MDSEHDASIADSPGTDSFFRVKPFSALHHSRTASWDGSDCFTAWSAGKYIRKHFDEWVTVFQTLSLVVTSYNVNLLRVNYHVSLKAVRSSRIFSFFFCCKLSGCCTAAVFFLCIYFFRPNTLQRSPEFGEATGNGEKEKRGVPHSDAIAGRDTRVPKRKRMTATGGTRPPKGREAEAQAKRLCH